MIQYWMRKYLSVKGYVKQLFDDDEGKTHEMMHI